MTHCASCGRQLKREPIMVNGNPMGPVCATKEPVVPPVGRDLFGYDIDAAAARAAIRLRAVIGYAALTAKRETARDYAAARERLGL